MKGWKVPLKPDFIWLQHISNKAATFREEMNCQPKSLSIMTISKSVPRGSGELTPDKPIKRGERRNKTSGPEDDGRTVDEAGTSNPSGMRGCQLENAGDMPGDGNSSAVSEHFCFIRL